MYPLWLQVEVQNNPVKCPCTECFNSLKNATLDILHTEIKLLKSKSIEFKIYKKSRSLDLRNR